MKVNTLAAMLAAFGTLESFPAGAQSQPDAKAAAGHVVAVHAGRLVDVVAGKVLLDQTILISGERITAVGPAASLPVPAGAERIDLSRATVLPA
jgi:imidazolonepropionase-like amidohydrolase